MDHIHPAPEKVISEVDDLSAWLNAPVTDSEVVAVSEDLARTELGWDPDPMTEDTSE
jgi:hypothetical protein